MRRRERWIKPSLVSATHRMVKSRNSSFLFGKLKSRPRHGDVHSAGPRISCGGPLEGTDPLIVPARTASCGETQPTVGGCSGRTTTVWIGPSTLRCSATCCCLLYSSSGRMLFMFLDFRKFERSTVGSDATCWLVTVNTSGEKTGLDFVFFLPLMVICI